MPDKRKLRGSMFGLDKIGLVSMGVAVVAEAMPITPWEKYLQGGALVVLAVIVIVFMLYVLPMLLKQLSKQSEMLAKAQANSAEKFLEGQKVQAGAIKDMADAFRQLSTTCALNQAGNRS